MLKKLLATQDDVAALVLRLGLGIVMFPHGAQKLFGWFGGYGFSGTMHFFTATMGIPSVFALAAILAESLGSIALIVGAVSRLAALAIGANMAVAIVMVHWQNGFFMNWYGNQAGEGFEYHLLALTLVLGILIKGGGLWSVDGWLSKKLRGDRHHELT